MKETTFGKDQVIFREGDNATTMYDILSGKVGIYKNYGAENEQQIIVMEAGQVFGEMGMIEYYPRSATAVALEDTVVEELGESELRDYFKTRPEKLLQLMKVLSQRVRETTQKYMDVCRVINDHEKARLAKNAEEMEKLRMEMEQYAGIYSNNWIDY
ncbi:MAG: cyclic nucleotide-binding domain-containing protein [Oscillospiraceae bacterium]|nr:cyclic nucleotide-binding domain-containing protein [Oscillospiraceae bacterium]